MADFDLARGLMSLSSGIEQRKARKEEEAFRRDYEGPLKEAYTNYYNVMVDKMQDKELLGYEKELKRAEVSGARAESGMTQATYDEIMRLRKGDDKEKDLARNYLLKIDQSGAFRDQLAAIRVQNEQLQTMISAQGQALGIQKFELDKTESLLGLLLSPEGANFLQSVLGQQGLEDVKAKVTEQFTGTKAPAAAERKPGGGISGFLMKRGAEVSKFITGAKPKPKPKAAVEEKKVEPPSEITTDEVASIADKAQENDVKWSDVLKGIEALMEKFPELSKADVLSAYEQLAAGFTIEELIAYYEGLKEK